MSEAELNMPKKEIAPSPRLAKSRLFRPVCALGRRKSTARQADDNPPMITFALGQAAAKKRILTISLVQIA
jgi:hypothetical protein